MLRAPSDDNNQADLTPDVRKFLTCRARREKRPKKSPHWIEAWLW